MREVKGLANTMRGLIAELKQGHAAAMGRFNQEAAISKVNLEKVNAVTEELAEANREVEAMLGDTGSNFPEQEKSQFDQNGVKVNK